MTSVPFGLDPAAFATTLVLASALMHATVNAVLKSGGDKMVARAIMGLSSAGFVLPAVLLLPWPEAEIWPLLAASLAVHFIYQLCVVNSYRLADFSLVYPVARGSAPLVTALGALLVLGEAVRTAEFLGIALLSAGILAFGLEGRRRVQGLDPHLTARSAHALGLALITGLTIAGYTLIDATGIRMAKDPLIYAAWVFVLDGTLFPPLVLIMRRGAFWSLARAEWKGGVINGLLSIGGYGLAMFALRYGATAEVAALRETSVVFAALIARFALSETLGRVRALASVAVAAGAILTRLG